MKKKSKSIKILLSDNQRSLVIIEKHKGIICQTSLPYNSLDKCIGVYPGKMMGKRGLIPDGYFLNHEGDNYRIVLHAKGEEVLHKKISLKILMEGFELYV